MLVINKNIHLINDQRVYRVKILFLMSHFIGSKEMSNLSVSGLFKIQVFRKGKLIHEENAKNGVTNVGKNLILDVMFHAETQSDPWYIGLIDTGASLAASDTMASHAGWSEFVDYSELVRQEWDEAAASSQSITSSTTADFSIDDTGSVYGAFVVDESTKSGATGTLWATAAFSGEIPVVNGDEIRVTYTVNAT